MSPSLHSHHCPTPHHSCSVSLGVWFWNFHFLLVLPCLSLPCLSASSQSQLVKNKSDGITLYWKSFNGFSSLLPLNSLPCPTKFLCDPTFSHLSLHHVHSWGLALATLRVEEFQGRVSQENYWSLVFLSRHMNTSMNKHSSDSLGVCSVGWVCPPRFCVHLEP